MVRHRPPFRIPSLILLLLQVQYVTSTCYGGDQNHTAESEIFTPCNQNTPFSMCIRTQVLNGFPPDTRCLPNGLVLSPINGQQFWRQGCTDPSWASDYCLKAFNACPNDANGNAIVTSCSGYGNSTTWCCGDGNTACCGQAGAITIAATIGPSSASSSTVFSGTSPSSIAVPTSTTTPSSVSPTTTSNGTGLSVGAEAGIGVGASLAGLAIIAGIVWFVLRTRRRRGELVDKTTHDLYIRKPELDGNTRGGWEGQDAANPKEPRLRHGVDTGVELRSELPAS